MPGQGRTMATLNWIYTYHDGIKDGTYTVGRWIELIYDYIRRELESGRLKFDSEKAADAIEWIETHCYHTEGPLAQRPLQLSVWQKAMLSCIYGVVDEEGRRQFREVLLVVGRKNGKTKIASALGDYEFRNEEFGSRVFCIAPKLDQADLVYNDIWMMVTMDPAWQELRDEVKEKDGRGNLVKDDSMLARHRQTDLSIPGMNSVVKKKKNAIIEN